MSGWSDETSGRRSWAVPSRSKDASSSEQVEGPLAECRSIRWVELDPDRAPMVAWFLMNMRLAIGRWPGYGFSGILPDLAGFTTERESIGGPSLRRSPPRLSDRSLGNRPARR